MMYRLWSNKHNQWWRPNSQGYTLHIDEAGLYTEADAIERVVASAQCGILAEVTYMVVAQWTEAAS